MAESFFGGICYRGPLLLPRVTPEMLQADFWIKALPNRAGGVARAALGPCFAPQDCCFEAGSPGMGRVVAEYLREVEAAQSHPLTTAAGEAVSQTQWELWREAVRRIPGQPVKAEPGYIVKNLSLKLLPTGIPLFRKGIDADLDRNQLSGLEPGDRVAVLGDTSDGRWLCVVTVRGVGWIPETGCAIGFPDQVAAFAAVKSRQVMLDARGFLISGDGPVPISMGCGLPALQNQSGRVRVVIPQRKPSGSLYFTQAMICGEIAPQALERTAGNLIGQAFRYLNCRYAWGDYDWSGRGRDCSRLVQDVLASLGIQAPRNSRTQYAAGLQRSDWRGFSREGRLSGLAGAAPGSLLFSDSHVMIYLGECRSNFYIIHACHSFMEADRSGERMRRVGQVVVSDLSLGKGSSTGSLLERLTGIVQIF